MMHASQRQLVERAMGHGSKSEALERHLLHCAACRQRLREFEGTLVAMAAWPAPERGADYGAAVWRRIEAAWRCPEPGGLSPATPPGWFPSRGWGRGAAWAAGLAVVVLGVFLWGHYGQRPVAPTAVASAAMRVQVLRVDVAAHLDRAQMLLLELAHAGGPANSPTIDLTLEQGWARELVASNRLFQQGADTSGQAAMAHLLGTLEPVLLQIAHSPAQATPAQWREMQSRIAASGILFKVRVADQNLQDKVQTQEQDGTL